MSANSKLKIVPETLAVDGLVRTATWEYAEPLYNKNVKFQIPNYAVPISVSALINGLEIRLQIDHLLNAHTKFYLMRLYDMDVIMNRVRAMQQSTLDGSIADEIFRRFFLGNVMILDTASESLYFAKNLKKYSNSNYIPADVRPIAKDLVTKYETLDSRKYREYKEKRIEDMWRDILRTEKGLNAFLAKIHERSVALYGDIILPFTKLILTKQDLRDVRRINEAWMALNKVEDKPTVAYILLSSSVLRNDSLIQDIVDYVQTVKADIIVLKVKNLHLTDGSTHARPREGMREILRALAQRKQQNKDLLTIALECGEQLYPFAIQAFDVVSTATNMYDMEREPGGTTEAGYGKALDEETLALTEYDDWERAFNSNGFFPCSHEFCRSRIVTMDKSRYTNREWWTDSRMHNIQTINDWMYMISQSVPNQTADLAVDRLRNSPIRILAELLIRNYEDPTDNL